MSTAPEEGATENQEEQNAPPPEAEAETEVPAADAAEEKPEEEQAEAGDEAAVALAADAQSNEVKSQLGDESEAKPDEGEAPAEEQPETQPEVAEAAAGDGEQQPNEQGAAPNEGDAPKTEADAGEGDAQAEAAEASGEAADAEAAAGEGESEGEGEGKGEGKGEGEVAEGEGGEATAAEGDAEAKEEKEAAEGGEKVEGEAAVAEGEGDEAAAGGEDAPKAEDDESGEPGEKKEQAEGEGEAGEERAESPARASEKLSREPTPTDEEAHRLPDRIDEEDEDQERPEPTTPQPAGEDELVEDAEFGDAAEEEGDAYEEEEDDYEEEEVEEEEYNRDFMIESYKQALVDREQKMQQNNLLQTKLSDYFRKKKADQAGAAGAEAQQETEKSITDQEQRYAKFLFHLEELRKMRDVKRQEFDERISDLEVECQSREEEVRQDFEELLAIKRKVGSKAVSATNGRPFPAVSQRRAVGPDSSSAPKSLDLLSTSVDEMLQEEAEMEDQVIKVRLENISLSNRVQKCESTLKDKEELSEGLHMIDFEQLKIENQTYNEKIEERQEELLKLKKKITNNVQILTHLKEKLQFVQSKKQEQHDDLQDLDEHLAKRRDQLTRTKQARDSLRNDNQRLKQNSGLLGNEPLLRNFEDNVDLVVEKKTRLEQLKLEQADLSLKCDKLKAKIREANRLQGVQ